METIKPVKTKEPSITETLDLLQDYFSTTDNVYIQHKLQLLKLEIEREIIKTKLETVQELNKD